MAEKLAGAPERICIVPSITGRGIWYDENIGGVAYVRADVAAEAVDRALMLRAQLAHGQSGNE